MGMAVVVGLDVTMAVGMAGGVAVVVGMAHGSGVWVGHVHEWEKGCGQRRGCCGGRGHGGGHGCGHNGRGGGHGEGKCFVKIHDLRKS